MNRDIFYSEIVIKSVLFKEIYVEYFESNLTEIAKIAHWED